MKVIFLDVDGVLNTHKLIRQFGSDHIDDVLVALVARIVKETKAEIVLSSTWRIREKDKTLVEQALARHGLEIFDTTPVIQRPGEFVERNEEIRSWLEANNRLCEEFQVPNKVEKFAIVDDFDDAGIEGSFFQTNEDRGITVEIVDRIIQHLGT
jgi:hypothetical protein